ncbi:Lrp/AsnC family transcriptional regulator [Streptomyces sp. NPDC001340]
MEKQLNEDGTVGLDDVDLQILKILQADGRATHAAIGKAVGLTGPSVYSRIRRLEREGTIRGYTTLIDPGALRQDLVAHMRVGTRADETEQEPFETFVRNEPQVLECHDVDGEDSYVLKIRTASPQSLRRLLARIRAIPGVTRTVTSIALETIKEPTASAHLTSPDVPGDKENPS